MRVVVLGAGVVGMTTAYYLWRDNHQVTVIDRQPAAGMESSFGNAGGLCPSFAGPWAAPGMVGKVLKMAMKRDAAIRFSLWPSPERLAWVSQWADNCNAESFALNKQRMQKVAHYSLRCLQALAEEADIDTFDYHAHGVLQLFRTPAELDMGRLSARTLESLGVAWQLLTPAEACRVEPALAATAHQFAGALHLPGDASGDSHKFCTALTAYLQQRGVLFRFNERVRRLLGDDREVDGVKLASGEILEADAYVVALGSFAPALLRKINMHMPVYPLKGYSLTVPIVDDAAIPHAALMDEHSKIMVSRLGDRIRVAGMADLVGYDQRVRTDRCKLLLRLTRELLPHGLDYDRATYWAGLRPMTPDGPPVIGATRLQRLYLNAGHGSNGWTQACGTSRIVADVIAGRRPEIDITGLTGLRFNLSRT